MNTNPSPAPLALHRHLALPRAIEERMLLLLRQGRLSKWFSGIGQEAIAVGATAALRPDDWILPLHRNLGVFTTRGLDPDRLFRQLFGRAGGYTQGRDRSFHFGTLAHHIVGMISHLGAMLPVACGLALAERRAGRDAIALVFSGDGGTSEGDFHEALNLAAVWKLPVIFLIENNGYGLSTPTTEQYACAALADRALGYGMPGERIDGNDLLAVHAAVTQAADRARRGEGPTLIECLTFRMRGHEEASGTAYVPDALIEEWRGKDPLARYESHLIAHGLATAEDLAAVRATLAEEVRALADRALEAPAPTSDAATEEAAVYAIVDHTDAIAQDIKRTPLRYIDAITAALRHVMNADDRVILLGQDIAEYGGVFKITAGFVERYGRDRVRNTPIIESGALGCALGLALAGQRPLVEMQFGDFIACGFNQIVNNLAKTRYRWGADVPVVVRVPHGGGVGAGPFHSQSVEGFFTGVAGLIIVAPATPEDAHGLLIAAFDQRDPVIYLEHKALYRSLTGPVPLDPVRVPIGVARIARAGSDATIITYGVGVHWALEAAEALAPAHAIEVIDLRTLQPWDRATVLDSVKKTSRALVLHEAPLSGGFGGEIAAVIAQHAFEWLDAPVMRLGGLDTPVPFARELEALHSPRARLLGELRTLLAY